MDGIAFQKHQQEKSSVRCVPMFLYRVIEMSQHVFGDDQRKRVFQMEHGWEGVPNEEDQNTQTIQIAVSLARRGSTRNCGKGLYSIPSQSSCFWLHPLSSSFTNNIEIFEFRSISIFSCPSFCSISLIWLSGCLFIIDIWQILSQTFSFKSK